MGIYRIGYQVDANDPVENIKFDNWINGNPMTYTYYSALENAHRYRVTNTPTVNGYLDCSTLAAGYHTVLIYAYDTYNDYQEVNNDIIIYIPDTGVDNEANSSIPKEFKLEKNYPNPFNLNTIIPYQIPHKSLVNVEIYNLLGQKVRDLISENKIPGYYLAVWNGTNDKGQVLASGTYVVRMTAISKGKRNYVSSYKINLIK